MNKKIFLTGTGNLRNNGEYAMVVGIASALLARAPDIAFAMLSKEPEENRAALGAFPMDVVQEFWFARRRNKVYYLLTLLANVAIVALGRLFRIRRAHPTLAALMDADLVVDLSGDSISTDYGTIALFERLYCLVLAKAAGKRVLLAGQTMGPFNSRLARLTSRCVLSMADRIVLREKRSLKHLYALKAKWPNLDADGADNAFLLAPDRDGAAEAAERERLVDIDWTRAVGLSPSNIMRLWFTDAGGAHSRERYIKTLVSVVDRLSRDYTVVLVPHVMDENNPDNNDLSLCRLLKQGCARPERVALIENYYNAAALKALMSRLRFMVALRMHAAIGALSVGRPALCWSYNDKFEGIIGEELGLREMVIDIRKLSMAEASEKLFEAVSMLENEGTQQCARKIKLKSSALARKAEKNIDLILEFLEAR